VTARSGPTTRFAPAPTGRLHLGHLANAIYVWGLARRFDGRVLLRIEDHDRQRCRPEYETALLDDLDQLGLAADEPSTDALRTGPSSYRQSDNGAVYAAALDRLGDATEVYACDCSRSTFAAWRTSHGRPWSGPGCPGGCLGRGLAAGREPTLRVALGDGDEAWADVLLGPRSGPVSPDGDPPVRDRNGNWTYALCVVVDDIRHGVGLVVRGEDLVDATPAQIRLGRLLGRETPPGFAHHPLIRRSDGSKLSKADGATSLGELLDAGRSAEERLARRRSSSGLPMRRLKSSSTTLATSSAEDQSFGWTIARQFWLGSMNQAAHE
jgi:glutamyl-tRNA synthetase/glutamyl-Q tRNA(Asp) synthetase